MKNERYYWFRRLKVLCMWVLDLESPDIVLENKGEGAIIYARRAQAVVPSHYVTQSGNVPECALVRAWPSLFNNDVSIGGYDSNRRL